MGRFLVECCVIGEEMYVVAKALRERYTSWCEEQGERPWSAQAIGREMAGRGFDSAQVGQKRTRSWLGIGLTTGIEADRG